MSLNRKKIFLRYSIASMAKKMSHLALLVGGGGVLLVILFFVMVTGKKEGFGRPPGPKCSPNYIPANGATSNSECTTICASSAKSEDGTKSCNGGYYNPLTTECECFMQK